MTLTELRVIDIPAAWARLTPERQVAIGEATIAWQLASLVVETAARDDVGDARTMWVDAHEGLADAVEAALPEIDWNPSQPSNPAGAT